MILVLTLKIALIVHSKFLNEKKKRTINQKLTITTLCKQKYVINGSWRPLWEKLKDLLFVYISHNL